MTHGIRIKSLSTVRADPQVVLWRPLEHRPGITRGQNCPKELVTTPVEQKASGQGGMTEQIGPWL